MKTPTKMSHDFRGGPASSALYQGPALRLNVPDIVLMSDPISCFRNYSNEFCLFVASLAHGNKVSVKVLKVLGQYRDPTGPVKHKPTHAHRVNNKLALAQPEPQPQPRPAKHTHTSDERKTTHMVSITLALRKDAISVCVYVHTHISHLKLG